ncbi:MAG: aldose 1-epimerase family protein [Ruminococcaceae bacterium]|nr:aldose 1-epimerase family protein [Oscillospiraceae bacterium]
MKYTIQNEKLKITVDSLGAQLCSVVCKEDGVEHIWEADPAVWEDHAPILFPYTGRLPGGIFTVDGKVYEGGIHGFAQHFEHTMVRCESNILTMELVSSPETLKKWPFAFRLESTFLLGGDTLYHSLRVKNTGNVAIKFGIGFHPGFAIPFDDRHTYEDYELRFDKMESPICLSTAEGGLVGDRTYSLGKNIRAIPIDDQLFINDSHLMVGLRSETLGIYEKDSNRAVVCHIADAPYNLIWSKAGTPRFVCIEPWQSIPTPDTEWDDKPAAACLQPGESYKTTMKTTFQR